MRKLSYNEVSAIQGGADWSGVPVAIATGVIAASNRWYQGDGVFSGASFLWGIGGAALGSLGYYGARALIEAFQPAPTKN